MKVKTALHFLIGFAVLIILSGCSTALQNLTSNPIPVNASGIYTFSLKIKWSPGNQIEDSEVVYLIINGESHEMSKSNLGPDFWECEYKMPAGQSKVKYYYQVEYKYKSGERVLDGELRSPIFASNLTNRYVIQLESERGPVGASIAVLGRGFSDMDTVFFNGHEVETRYISPTTLNFTVPSIPADETYSVALQSGPSTLEIGAFKVDPATIYVNPQILEVASGETVQLLFRIDLDAPQGGLYLDVSTDIPASVIMPEVSISEGTRSINIPVEGGIPGNGKLVVTAPGFLPLEIPVRVY